MIQFDEFCLFKLVFLFKDVATCVDGDTDSSSVWL